MKITLHDDHDLQTTYEGKIVRYSSMLTIVNQLNYRTNNVLKGSLGHYLIRHQSYCARFSYTPKILVVFNINVKMQK